MGETRGGMSWRLEASLARGLGSLLGLLLLLCCCASGTLAKPAGFCEGCDSFDDSLQTLFYPALAQSEKPRRRVRTRKSRSLRIDQHWRRAKKCSASAMFFASIIDILDPSKARSVELLLVQHFSSEDHH